MDIIAWLEADEERKKCLARLMERARHEDHESQALQLADGYLRDDTSPGDDDMLSRVAREDVGGDLEVRYWRDSSQLEEQLAAAMRKHLKLTDDKKAYIPFNASLGLHEDAKDNDPVLAERWQILSPVRNHEFGTTEINRKIQAKYRGGMLNYSKSWSKGIKPFGEQEIVWTDKVMQSINCRKTSYPKGEGLGLRRQWRDRPRGADIQRERQAGLDQGPVLDSANIGLLLPRPDVDGQLELAYALTVHKSQGSDFDIVFLDPAEERHARSHGNCCTPA